MPVADEQFYVPKHVSLRRHRAVRASPHSRMQLTSFTSLSVDAGSTFTAFNAALASYHPWHNAWWHTISVAQLQFSSKHQRSLHFQNNLQIWQCYNEILHNLFPITELQYPIILEYLNLWACIPTFSP